MGILRSMPLMEYSPSCVFPTKLVSEYDDVFLFFFASKRYSPRQEWRKGKGFFWYFFSSSPFFISLNSLCFFVIWYFFFRFWIFPLVVKKNKWSWKKLDRSKSSVYYLSAEQPTKCTGWLRFRAWIVLVYPQLGNNKTGWCARWSKLCWFGLVGLGWAGFCLRSQSASQSKTAVLSDTVVNLACWSPWVYPERIQDVLLRDFSLGGRARMSWEWCARGTAEWEKRLR